MCLYDAKFAMQFNKELGYYVGYGWKKYTKKPITNKWLTAGGQYLVDVNEQTFYGDKKTLKDYEENGIVLKPVVDSHKEYDSMVSEIYKRKVNKNSKGRAAEYPAGFHIFLDEKDANTYGYFAYNNCYTYRVQFTDILAFGRNETGDRGKRADCVIAKYMWVFPQSEKYV